MNDEEPDVETADGIRAELNTILPGSGPMQNMTAVQTGPVHYTILSARNGSATTHRVNLQKGTCTCEDMEYNVDQEDSRDVCAHVAFAATEHPQLTGGESVLLKSFAVMDGVESINAKAEAALEGASEANVAARETEAAAVQEATDEEVANSEPDGQAAAEAADTLQEAFDEHLEDMQVQHHVGYVWFQTGKDTEDEWPYPGVDETFEAVTSPDVVEYVYESDDGANHELFSEKPGEWWKNALEPGDVEEYISEVLE